VNGQGAATSTGFFPAQAEPAGGCMARTMPGAKAQLRHGGSLLTQPSDSLKAREEARRKAPLAPEDQANHIPNVVCAPS
jgi:hypothetical protein